MLNKENVCEGVKSRYPSLIPLMEEIEGIPAQIYISGASLVNQDNKLLFEIDLVLLGVLSRTAK